MNIFKDWFSVWLAVMFSLAEKIDNNKDRFLLYAMFEALRRAVVVFFVVNVIVFIVENIIWGSGFLHFGDTLLISYLFVELISLWYSIWQLNTETKRVKLDA